MAEVGARVELEERLAELERERRDGELTEIGYNLQRNLLITRSDELARRRSAAAVLPLHPDPPPASRRVVSPPRRAAPPEGRDTGPRAAQPAPGRRSRTGLTSRPALLVAAVIVVAGVAFGVYHATSGPAEAVSTAAAHSGGAGGATRPTTEPSPTAPGNSAPASPPIVIDVTQATLTGGSVTLLGYADHFGSGSSINNPLPSGAFYAAVQLRICAGPVESIVSPFQFVLTEPDKTQVGVATGPTVGRQPELSLQQLSAESCTTGWLSYGVPSRPTALDDTGDSLTWAIPA
jgi:hypothetical protein